MGIKDLWTILGPYCERKPLYELQGKTVAVDLSCWICESQNISEYQVQPRMYLRNLFFRTCFLLLMEVNPVFVLEGKAPTLKHGTIAARNAMQFKGARPKTEGVKTGKDRSRFNFTLKQCEEMLRYMGLACIQGNGEAEAMCAYLNDDGMVDGCISQDSDCFAYGAKVVYRNFSISQQGAHAASGGAVDVYNIQKAIDLLGFGRNKIIAMALLCGSDYSAGVHGVGKDSATKFLENIPDLHVLDVLRSWRTNEVKYAQLSKQIADKNTCTSCGHFGKAQAHTKSGCRQCGTNSGCDSATFKEERLAVKNELSIRMKSLADPEFPNEELISEFLVRKDKVSGLDLKWKQPDMVKFVKFTTKYLTWEEIYGFEKLLPILTRWQLIYYESILQNNGHQMNGTLQPNYIKKSRNPKGVTSYEIVWHDPENFFKTLVPDEQLLQVDPQKLWATIEPQGLVQKAYPDLVHAYEQSKIKPKKTSKRKQKTKDPVADIENMLQNTSISEQVVTKKPRTTKKKSALADLERSFSELNVETKKKPKTIDNYFKQAILNNCESIKPSGISTPNKLDRSFDLDMSNFGDENCLDVSDIVDGIIAQEPPKIIRKALSEMNLKLNFESENAAMDVSSFFITNPTDNDLFEQTFNKNLESSSSDENTQEYEFDANLLTDFTNHKSPTQSVGDEKSLMNHDAFNEAEDSFEIYVPLYERIKMKM